jgi:hypothetical protein
MRAYERTMAVLLALGFAACATTSVKAVWKDEAYQNQPKKVLVISMFKNETARRMVEDEFRKHLRYRGIDSAPGYEVFPGSELPTKETIVEKVRSDGFDSLLLIRLIDTRTEQRTITTGPTTYAPAHYGMPMTGYYNQGYQAYYSSTYQVEDRYATVQSNFYDAATERLVWTATSDTWLADSDQKTVKTFVSVMMESLQKQKIVH